MKKWGRGPRQTHRGGEVPIFNRVDRNTVVAEPKAPPPATSWWLGAESREEFVSRHRQQLVRIKDTGFGRRQMLITPPSGGA